MELIYSETGDLVGLTMVKPADMHHHLRQGPMLRLVAPMAAARFSRSLVMPNTIPPITSEAEVLEYSDDIRRALGGAEMDLLMTMYLTDTLDPEEVDRALERKNIVGVKYYPRGLTTNSDSGVQNPRSLWTPGERPYEVLRVLARRRGVLFLHAADGFDESGTKLDPFEQEPYFIRNTLPRIIDAHPSLKISVEHISTSQGVEFVRANGGERLGCSVTVHHLTLDRRDLFEGGFRPHRSWMPIIQDASHRAAIADLVCGGYPFVWLGTDSAPHPRTKKESDCCASGVLMAHAAIELYVEAFEAMGKLELLEAFASVNGPAFLGLPPSDGRISLVKKDWVVQKPFFALDADMAEAHPTEVIPFRLGETVRWKLLD